MPPWVVLVFDALAAVALPWALRTSGTLRQKQTVTLLASCIVSVFIVIVVDSAIHPKLKAVTEVLSPEAIAAARMVIFETINLPWGQPFPLLPYIRIRRRPLPGGVEDYFRQDEL